MGCDCGKACHTEGNDEDREQKGKNRASVQVNKLVVGHL